MAEKSRRIGCGCLPLIVIFFIGSFFVGVAEQVDLPGNELFGPAIVALVVAWILIGAFRRSRRQELERDAASDGAPTPTERTRPTVTAPAPPPSPAPSFEEREKRRFEESEKKRKSLLVEPEAPEVVSLKKRLAEAVTDLSDTVEGMSPTMGDGLLGMSSTDMIAQAKDRIAHWDEERKNT